MGTSLTRYERKYYSNPSGMSDTALIIGAVLFVGIVLYLLLRNKTGTLGAATIMPNVKQWQIKYNEDGLMSAITLLDMPKV